MSETAEPGPIQPQQIDHLFGVPIADWHAIWIMARNRNMEPLRMAREWDATIARLTRQRDALAGIVMEFHAVHIPPFEKCKNPQCVKARAAIALVKGEGA